MKNVSQIKETQGIAFQTSEISKSESRRMAHAVGVIRVHFIDKDAWKFWVEKGSVSLQKHDDPRQVIKVFIDHGLSNRIELKIPQVAGRNEFLVIGVELSHMDPYSRDGVRDRLAQDFADLYSDPRSGGSKVWLQPIDSHLYDVIFIPEAYCSDFEITEDEFEYCLSVIEETQSPRE